MKFVLSMNCNNDAFFGDACENEVVRILQDVRERIMTGDAVSNQDYILFDLNGNTVGKAYFEEQQPASITGLPKKGIK